MIFKRGQNKVKLPAYSEIQHVFRYEWTMAVALNRVTYEDMLVMREHNSQGEGSTMTFYSIYGRELHIWPTPKEKMEIRVRYAPPVEEI